MGLTVLGASAAALIGMTAGPHPAAALPTLVCGVLVPLMLPRVGARLRRALAAEHSRLPGDVTASARFAESWTIRHDDDFDADPPEAHDLVLELTRKNARLAQELRDLRNAYARLVMDAAERAAAAGRLHHLAYHDYLTQLPNRVLLMDRLAQALAYAQRAGTGVLVMYLDLDNFKTINDTLGHAAGDSVLCEIGRRIASCMRTTDTASRVGGDEFVLVCPTADAGVDAAQILARLQRKIAEPIDVDGTLVVTGASIGVSLFPLNGSDAAELIHRADQAMYVAKADRGG